MRPAGRFVGEVLTALGDRADVGVNLLELDELAHGMIRDRGAESCYIDYHPSFGASPFGKVLCTSVNDAVLHGLRTTTCWSTATCSAWISRARSTAGWPTRRFRSSSAPPGSRING